jgi:mannose-6-phosphate isomerase-like protein (cupin superfamily)
VSYAGERGEVSAVLRSAGDVESVTLGSGPRGSFIAPGSLTAARFGLFRWDMPAGSGGAGPHFHRTFSESFFVLDGVVRLFDGRRWLDAGPGDFLYVPDGGVHGFNNKSGADASMLILFAPGAPREDYFRELAEITTSGRQLSDGEWKDLFRRHDQYAV